MNFNSSTDALAKLKFLGRGGERMQRGKNRREKEAGDVNIKFIGVDERNLKVR